MTDREVERRRTEYASVIGPRRLRTQNAKKKRTLLTFNNIPDFLRDNEYITTGYRANWSLKDTGISLFQLHNETFNIWTHLLGFFVFVGLTVYVAMMPPAPMGHPKESLEHLWTSMQDRMHHFGDNVQSWQDSFDPHIGALHDTLHESLVVIQSYLHDNLEHAKDSFQTTIEPISKKLHRSFSSLSLALHHVQDSLGHMADSVNTRLSIVVNNLEKSFNSVQENLHHMQNDLSGNFGVAKSRFKHALTGMQDNLSRLQILLRDARSKGTPNVLNNTLPEQCPNTAYAHTIEELKSVRDRVVRWPVFLFMSGAMFCLLVSSICHLFACCSQHASKYMWRFDYTGISVLIVTSFYPNVYYGFFCEPHWVTIYLGIITFLGLGTVYISLDGNMQAPKFRRFRASMFSALGLFGVFPIAHSILIHSHEPWTITVIQYEFLMASFYLIGAGFFVSRIPERFKPGAFDIVFHSHQIFHIFVVIAACCHFQAVMHLMEWRESTNGCPAQ